MEENKRQEGEAVNAETAVLPVELVPQEAKSSRFGTFFLWLERKGQGNLPLLLAFLLPFVIFTVCLAVQGVYPFGDRQIINYDGWHQYYPFLLNLWDHFREGTSLLYDWSMGMGTNFLSMLSYYGASPLNLLIALAPEREFRLLFMLFTAVRIALAGGFFALFLRKVMKARGWSIAFFALGYALCGYLMGYYWNNMWLDCVALYPLLCWGEVKLFREGKSSFYILILAITLFSNYYIGFMCCVFTALLFFVLCVLDRVSFLDFVKKGFRLLLSTLLGAAVPAVLLLPALFGLFNTASTTNLGGGVYVSFYESIRDLLAPLSSFHIPAVMDGLPNLSTSAILVLFAFAFLWAKKISLREKLCGFFVVIVLLVSMNFSVFNYAWHGFHFTNMIPYRFAFLFAFAVVVMAYRYYQKAAGDFDWIDALGMLIFSFLIAFCAFGYYPSGAVLATVAVFAAGIMLCAFFSVKILPRKVFSSVVCFLLALEMAFSAYLGTREVGTTGYSDYFNGKTGEEMMELVGIAEEREEGKENFYRLESTEWWSLNDSCLYGYNGISQFASSANRRVSYFLQALGMPADPGSNRFVYVHGTPLADTMLGIKYLVNKNGVLTDTGLIPLAGGTNETTAALYECENFAGLGFLLESDAAAFEFDLSMPVYERQNELFSAITGLEGDLFFPIAARNAELTGLEAENPYASSFEVKGEASGGEEIERVIRLEYEVPQSGMVYIYADVPLANYTQVNNAWHCIEDYPNFFSAGYFAKGESFRLRTVLHEETTEEFTDWATFYVCCMNEALWKEGLARLQDERMQIEKMGDTELTATVTAKKDGYLYTSIPMEEEGSWTVLVDGEEAEVIPFAGSFVGVMLEEGEHEISFSYRPLGFSKGRWISLGAICLLILLFVWEKKGHKLFPETPAKKRREKSPQETGLEEQTEKNEEKGENALDHTEIDVDHAQGD